MGYYPSDDGDGLEYQPDGWDEYRYYTTALEAGITHRRFWNLTRTQTYAAIAAYQARIYRTVSRPGLESRFAQGMTEEGARAVLEDGPSKGNKTIQQAFEKLDWALRPPHMKRKAVNPEFIIVGLSREASRGICEALGAGRFDPETRRKLFSIYARLKATAGY